ncbi:aldehyde dehydrogenase family protein [Nodosilinea sp. FACHB-13]|uniref:aldehyde dehydrogenase family protein n=1 Tax=Cyanophyceae TaxID=3028117 RepID=UPI0016891C53|nr:aldehyde dehydrogenase family protein [Nodosilinea sp. FACHB-13]MBD2107643.1 aldehyde dehydrogenase family protein [Nodosilinea sp. FACHB-13]
MTTVAATAPIADLLQRQRAYWATGATRGLDFRLAQLKALRAAIVNYQADIIDAARQDLGRPEFEGYFEVGTISELDYAIKHLHRWVKPRKTSLPLSQLPGSAWVQPEPLGVVLIIGPWNYPFQLIVSPLMGAIAAGNCAMLKPSELAPTTSKVLARLIADTFDPAYVALVEGGVDTAQALLAEKFNHIFFTGGERIGKIVMQAAAQHLTPVTLELGGKSPCIIDTDVNLEVAARRIVWGKFLNAGQTCVAPDYLLVDERVKDGLVTALQQRIQVCYGEDPATSPDLSRVVNDRQFDRLVGLLNQGNILAGGQHDRSDRYIAPTLIDGIGWDASIMQEEIFGPILPILTYKDLGDAIAAVNQRPKPLALYVFTRDRQVQERVLDRTTAGSVCINDVILQIAIWDLPFGGVGSSGVGSYHGQHSFNTFSHLKSVLKKPFWMDMDWR